MEQKNQDAPVTKEVEGHFGPKQITREDFIKRWSSHFVQFYYLADTAQDHDRLVAIGKELCDMAGRAWDRLPIEREPMASDSKVLSDEARRALKS